MEASIIRQIHFNHYLEGLVIRMQRLGMIKIPIYLSYGSEHIGAIACNILSGVKIFCQHRCHSWYLSSGGDALGLLLELAGSGGGCNGGYGGSASISCANLFGHSGLLGDQIPIAIGYSDATSERVIGVIGDAGVEEDYVLGALGYAGSRRCNTLIIVEDNNLSILTPKSVRRAWDIISVARSFGIPSYDIADDYESISSHIERFKESEVGGPMLLNINICRHLWHAGCGDDGRPLWNRYEEMGLGDGSVIREEVEGLWLRLLERLGE